MLSNIQETEVMVVHGGDNALRARAAAIELLFSFSQRVSNLVLKKRVIIFSGGCINGAKKSEAQDMYKHFIKRLKVLGYNITEATSGDKKTITINGETIDIYLEDKAIDTEDNILNSLNIIKDLSCSNDNGIEIIPISSNFHIPRIRSMWKRHLSSENGNFIINAKGAENIFKDSPHNLHKMYGVLKELKIHPKTKILEVILRILSKHQKGRDLIKKETKKRISQ